VDTAPKKYKPARPRNRRPRSLKQKFPFTPKQQVWIEEYVKCGSVQEAGKRAGYSQHVRPTAAMRKEVDRRMALLAERSVVTAEFVVKELHKVALQDDLTSRTKLGALQTLSRILGMEVQRHEVKSFSAQPEEVAREVVLLLGQPQKALPGEEDDLEEDGYD